MTLPVNAEHSSALDEGCEPDLRDVALLELRDCLLFQDDLQSGLLQFQLVNHNLDMSVDGVSFGSWRSAETHFVLEGPDGPPQVVDSLEGAVALTIAEALKRLPEDEVF